jgi:hypothetical protein
MLYKRFESRCSETPSDNYNVTVVNADKCKVTVEFIMFGAGEPLIVTWIIMVSKRAVTDSLPDSEGRKRERESERERVRKRDQ